MFGRSLILLLALAAAVAIPFVASKTSNVRREAAQWWLSGETQAQPQAAEIASSDASATDKPTETLLALRPRPV